MAENVQKTLEEYSKYLVLMQHVELFTGSEIRQLVKKIRQGETTLSGGPQLLENYRKIIELIICLIKEIKRRKREKNVATAMSGEHFFVNKVRQYYQKGLRYFPDNYDFNLEYFNFIKLFPEHQNIAGLLIKKLLTNFGGKRPDVYRKAASFYFNTKNYKETRKVLLAGQNKHPHDIDIYLDLIELELITTDKTSIGEKLKRYVDYIAENKLPSRFMEETILVIDAQKDLRSVAEYALEKLLSTYNNEVESYVFAANWELKASQSPSNTEDSPNSEFAIKRGIKRLKQGISAVPPSKKEEIWKCYIDFTKKVVAENPEPNPKLEGLLDRALQEAEKAKVKLSEEHLIDWIYSQQDNQDKLLVKLEKAVQLYSTSDTVWCLYLKTVMLAKDWAKADVEFRKALDALGGNTLRVWDVYLSGITDKLDPEDMKKLFEKAVNDPYQHVASAMKAKYYVWTCQNFGQEEGRELYFKLAKSPPYSNELHREMYQIEQNSGFDVVNGDVMSSMLSLWQAQFGTVEKDVYLRWIEFLNEKAGPDHKTDIAKVYRQAVQKLGDPEAVAAFKTSFATYETLRAQKHS